MASGETLTDAGGAIQAGSLSSEPSPTSDEYEDAPTQFRSSRSNSASSLSADQINDIEPPYSLVPPEGEIYTNHSARNHPPAPSRSSDDDIDPALPTFRPDTWYTLHPVSDAHLAIDVINDGRAHIDGKLHLTLAGRFSGQFWNIRRADSESRERGCPLWVLATMYLGASMVLTAGLPVRLAPYQGDTRNSRQHWRISEMDGACRFTLGSDGEVALEMSGQGLVVGETDDGQDASTDRARWRVERYEAP